MPASNRAIRWPSFSFKVYFYIWLDDRVFTIFLTEVYLIVDTGKMQYVCVWGRESKRVKEKEIQEESFRWVWSYQSVGSGHTQNISASDVVQGLALPPSLFLSLFLSVCLSDVTEGWA